MLQEGYNCCNEPNLEKPFNHCNVQSVAIDYDIHTLMIWGIMHVMYSLVTFFFTSRNIEIQTRVQICTEYNSWGMRLT